MADFSSSFFHRSESIEISKFLRVFHVHCMCSFINMQEKTCLQVIQIKLRYKRQAFESEI